MGRVEMFQHCVWRWPRPAPADLPRALRAARDLRFRNRSTAQLGHDRGWDLSLAGGGRRVCPGALRRLDAWLDGRGLQDATLAAYLAELTSLRRIPDEERRSRSRATAAAPARRVAGREDGRRGPPPGTAGVRPGRGGSLRWGRRRRR